MERVFGLLGLALLVFVVAVVEARTRLGPACSHRPAHPHVPGGRRRLHLRLLRHRAVRRGDDALRGVLLLVAARSRSSWTDEGPRTSTAPTCSSASRSAGCCRWRSWRCATLVLAPARHRRRTPRRRSRCRSPSALGKVGLAVVLLGIFAATFGAALETALSSGYMRRAVLRLAVGQVRRAPRGGPLPPRRARRSIVGRARRPDRRRPGQGHRVLDRAVGRRAAAHLLPDPRRRQRPRLHGRQDQRPAAQRHRDRLPRHPRRRRGRHDPADDHHEGRRSDGRRPACSTPALRPARPPARRPRRRAVRQRRRPRARPRRRRHAVRHRHHQRSAEVWRGGSALRRLGAWLEAHHERFGTTGRAQPNASR